MTQLDAYAREGGSVSTVIPVPPDRSTGTKLSALGMMVTPSSVNWHGNCTNIGVSKFLDWLVS
jgi:hypothetical protein